MSLEIFNSRLLGLVQKNYKGPAYSKFLEAISTLEQTASIEQACSQLFRRSIDPVEPPKPYHFESFGTGNVSQDFLTALYIDDMLGKAFDLIKTGNYEEALNEVLYPNEQILANVPRNRAGKNPEGGKEYFLEIPEAEEMPDNLWLYQKILPTTLGGKNNAAESQKKLYRQKDMKTKSHLNINPIRDYYQGKPKDLLFRFEIYKGFIQYCQIELNKPFADIYLEYPPYPYLVENLDDLAICGICGMLDHYFDSVGGETFFNLDFIVKDGLPRPDLSSHRSFDLPDKVLNSLSITFNKDPGYYNDHLASFFKINSGYKIPDPRPDLNLSLSNLLASSSFLWGQEIFDVDTSEIEAMTQEQRVNLLTQNKARIIQNCFSYLYNDLDQKEMQSREKASSTSGPLGEVFVELTKDTKLVKNKIENNKIGLISLSEQIESKLIEKNEAKKQYQLFEKNKLESQRALEEIGSRMDQNSTQVLSKIFEYISKGIDFSKIDEDLNGFDQMILQLLQQYKHNLFQCARYKELAQEKSDQLKILNQGLEQAFEGFQSVLSEENLKRENIGSKILEVYIVFSFILFNKDLFPDVPIASYKKKKASEKLLKIFSKSDRLEKSDAFNLWKENNPNILIQKIIDKQVDKIFSAYKTPSQQGKIKSLNTSEIENLADAARKVVLNREKIGENFFRLSKVIEEMLFRDQVFWGSLDRLGSVKNAKQTAEIQSYMNACLMFSENEYASLATGVPQSVGFKKLMDSILYSLGDTGVKAKKIKESNKIIKALEDFNIEAPKETFEKAVRKEVLLSTKKDITSSTIEVLPSEFDRQTKDLGYILEKIQRYLIEKISGFPGKPEIIDTSKAKKTTGNLSLDFVFEKIPQKYLNLSSSDMKIVNEVVGSRALDPSEIALTESYIQDSARKFIIDNQIETSIGNASSFINRLFYIQGYDLLGLTAVYDMLLNEYKNRVKLHNSQKAYTVVKKYQGNPQNQANVFDQTIVQWYEQKQKSETNNQDLSLGVYEQFLPIFLSSFFEDIKDLNLGSDFFSGQKMSLIKHLPGAEKTFQDIGMFLKDKRGEFLDLSKYIEKSFNEDQENFFSETWLKKTYDQINRSFSVQSRQLMSNVSEFVVVAVILSLATKSTSLGIVPYLSTFVGLLGAYYWMNKIGPVVKDIFYFLQESCKYIATEKYTNKGVNQFILGLIETAFTAEQKMLSSPKWKDLKHQFAFTLFLQEEFSMLRNLRSDLKNFTDRLHYLVPKTIANTNISAMAINFFYMFNKEIFTILPDELLRGIGSEESYKAINQYIFQYTQLINRKKISYQGSESDKDLSYGSNSPLKRQLAEEARQRKLFLSFPRSSDVYRFLQKSKGNLLQKSVEITLSQDQIIPVDQVDFSSQAENLRRFLDLGKTLLLQEKTFLEQTNIVMKRLQQVSSPLDKAAENTAIQGMISSYYMMRYCLSLAKNIHDGLNLLSDNDDEALWMIQTGETPVDILTSTLFRESVSILRKIAEFGLSSEIPGSVDALNVLSTLDRCVADFLQTGILQMPSFEDFESLLSSFQKMIGSLNENPQILMPILIEYENNKNLFLPQVLIQQAMNTLNEELREDARAGIQMNFGSKILYLTNSDSEMFFVNRNVRGFGMSPLMVDALNNILQSRQDQRLLSYLGVMGSRQDQMIRSQGAIPRFQQRMRQFIQPEQSQRALPMSENINNQNIPQTASMERPEGFMPTYDNRPKIDVAREQYQNPRALQPSETFGVPGNRNAFPSGQENNLLSASDQMANPTEQRSSGKNSMQQPIQQRQDIQMQAQDQPLMIPDVPMQERDPGLIYEDPMQLQNQISVDVEGREIASSFGSNDSIRNQFTDQNIQPSQPYNFLGQGDAAEYRNPINPNPEDLIQQRPDFPIGSAAMIGGGLVLGASLLGGMVKDKERKKKRS